MVTSSFKVGGVVWRGYRYWRNLGNPFGPPGWNTAFLPYRIIEITSSRIVTQHEPYTMFGKAKTAKDWKRLILNRATMERDGKQYHTRYHEYFYAKKPKVDPEHEYQFQPRVSTSTKAMTILNLSAPYSAADVRRAYKRLALKAHPDLGGNDAAFIKLKQAHDEALRYAGE